MPKYERGDYVKVEFPDEATGIAEWMWVRVHQPVERMMVLSQKNGRNKWNQVPVRSTIEGAARNKTILAQAQELLDPDEPMTLRHLFYMLVSRADTVITNCSEDYSILSKTMTAAREDGDVDDKSITDEHRTVYKSNCYDSPAEWAYLEETTYRKNRWTSQDSYVECWFEKGAVMSVVERLHRRYQVTMRPFKGQASRAYCADIAKDFSLVDKPITVYYFGDHDPSGYAIPRSGAKRVRAILEGEEYGGINADFTFIRIGFNRPPVDDLPCDEMEYCEVCSHTYKGADHLVDHNLPSWDVEDKRDDSNYRWFVDHFGDECAELDAIPPDELRTMVEDSITSHITDRDAWDAVESEEETEREKIKKALRKL
jgi:hypothetical protein